MRCPRCEQQRLSSTLTRLNQTADNPKAKPAAFVDQKGAHYHDPRIWTATLICSEGHTFVMRQKLPCTAPTCSWNKDEATRPVIVKVIDPQPAQPAST